MLHCHNISKPYQYIDTTLLKKLVDKCKKMWGNTITPPSIDRGVIDVFELNLVGVLFG